MNAYERAFEKACAEHVVDNGSWYFVAAAVIALMSALIVVI